jgi:predicted molibdopterin-dependent oxidoreductase YjgC
MSAREILQGDGAARCAVLVVADSDFGAGAWEPETVARLRRAKRLVVLGWADSPLAREADVALPIATHAETSGTFVNVERRLQRFERSFPPPGLVRPGVEVLGDLLSRFDGSWSDETTPAEVFARLAAARPAFSGLAFDDLPATGTPLAAPAEEPEAALVE